MSFLFLVKFLKNCSDSFTVSIRLTYTKTSLFLRKPAKPDFLKKRSLLTNTALKLFFKIPNSFLMRYKPEN